MFRAWMYCFIFLLTFSCSSPESDLKLDSKAWKNDLNGCKGDRLKLRGQVEEIRLQLEGLKEWDIRRVLGKPDSEELLEKSQKIYIYYITPGPKCTASQSGKATGKKEALTVRIDALGTVREANVFAE